MTDSQQLLADYARTGSDIAFRELVTRYVDLVYSTALRLVDGDAHRAQDVAQTVFVDLVAAARTLPAEVMLGGWLHRHTCFAAAKAMRSERRRQSRERQAVALNALQTDPGTDFSHVAPLLDAAINELGDADRVAILLRFFEQQDFRAVGARLGSNEDAARMRVNRALDKLQDLLKQRGVTTGAASLAVALSANAVTAAPAGLAATISTATALAGTAVTATVVKTLVMTTLQKTLLAIVLVAVVGVGTYQAYQVSQRGKQTEPLPPPPPASPADQTRPPAQPSVGAVQRPLPATNEQPAPVTSPTVIIPPVGSPAAAVKIAPGGVTITGKVTLKGTPPPEVSNTPLLNDPVCGKLHATPPTSHHWVVSPEGGLANVVVMLKNMNGHSTGPTVAPAVLDQVACEYTPTILAIQTGQKILVKNSDPVAHNVHPLPMVTGNPEANLLQAAGAAPLTFTFSQPENFLRFKCDVHSWMFSWVTVVDHPYFAVTDRDGHYTIQNVPPGKYTVIAIHRKAAPGAGVEKDVEVTAAGATLDYVLEIK